MFAHFGTHVTLVEAKDRVFGITEPEISHALEAYFRKEGIEVYTKAKVTRVRKEGGQVVLTIERKGEEGEVAAERLFAAIGVSGNTQDLGLDTIGLAADKNGFIEVDETMATKVPGVWAAGDVAGPPWLETVAAKEAAIAVEHVFTGKGRAINYDAVPGAVFTEPQVATVGLTEEEVIRRYGSCDCRTVELKFVPKADITSQTHGVAKMVIHPESQKIAGFHLMAPNAAEIIHEAALAIQHGLTVDDLINLVHVFPTYSEVVKITAQAFRRDVSKMSCCVE